MSRCATPALCLAFVLIVCSACRDDAVDIPESLPDSLPLEELRTPATPTIDGLNVDAATGVPSGLAWGAAPAADAEPWRESVTIDQRIRQSGPGLPSSDSELNQQLIVTHRRGEGDVANVVSTIETATLEMVPKLPELEKETVERLTGSAWQHNRQTGAAKALGKDEDAATRAATSALGQVALSLQPGPLAPGATWNSKRKLSIPLTAANTVPATVDTTFTLRGTAKRDGRTLAVIDVAGTQTLRGDVTLDGAKGQVVGAARSVGVVLFDVEAGAVVESHHSLVAKQRLLLEIDGKRHLLEQEQDVTIRTRPPEAKPAP